MSPHNLRWSAAIVLSLLGTTWASRVPGQSPPGLVINDVTVPENNSGSVVATFTVSFADASPHGAVIVFYTTAAGTASSGGQCGTGVDFVGVSGLSSVTLSASEQSKAINITVCGDARDEPDQTFFVNITARGAAVQDGKGQGTIIDDDPLPVLSVRDGRNSEGAAGATTTGGFTVSLAGLSENTVSVNYATVNRSAIGGLCGSQGADFEKASSTLTFN